MQTVNQLNRQHAIPGHIQFALGPGMLPTAYINNKLARATVSLLGGHLLTYHQHDYPGIPIWMSELATYEVGKAIRGGIPIIWPWFGDYPERPDLPAHGLVRSRMWEVVRTEALGDGGTKLVMAIESDEETHAFWPYNFRLDITFTFGSRVVEDGLGWPESLAVALTAHNTGDTSFHWSGALHTYFDVANRSSVYINGLNGVPYLDKVHGGVKNQDGLVYIREEVDRVYLSAPAKIELVDLTRHSEYAILPHDADTTIVWNPDETAKKADLSEQAFYKFVCVETAYGAGATTEEQMPLLEAGDNYTFSVSYHRRHH